MEAVVDEHRSDDVLADAIVQHAMAMRVVAKAIDRATDQRVAFDNFWHSFSARWEGLCGFMHKRGPWVLGSIPMVLVSVGAITPNVAGLLAKLIASWTGVHP